MSSRSLEMIRDIGRISARTQADCGKLGRLLREAGSVLTKEVVPSIRLDVASIVDHLAVARLGEVYAVLGYRPDRTAGDDPRRCTNGCGALDHADIEGHSAGRNGQPVA